MGTATNSPPAIALGESTELEANWLAGSCEKIRDCHKRRAGRHVESMIFSAAVDCPSIFSQLAVPDFSPLHDSCRGLLKTEMALWHW